MLLMKPSATLRHSTEYLKETVKIIEEAGRTAWLSFGKKQDKIDALISDPEFYPELNDEERIRMADMKTANDFFLHLMKVDHTSVFEHSAVGVRFITDRAVSHQMVRHRIGVAITQQSQRYVAEGEHIRVIIPEDCDLEPGFYTCDGDGTVSKMEWNRDFSEYDPSMATTWKIVRGLPLQYQIWAIAIRSAEEAYGHLRAAGMKPEDARSVLPNATKTELFLTLNIRAWRHMFRLRLDKHAQHDIRKLMGMVLRQFMASPLAPLFYDFWEQYGDQHGE